MEEKSFPESGDNPTIEKRQAWSEDEKDEVWEVSLKNLLRPFLYSMALVGCYNFSDIHKNTQRKASVKSVFSTSYRVIVLMMVLVYLAKTGASFFFVQEEAYQFTGLYTVWLVSLVVVYCVNIKTTSSKYGQFEKACTFWDDKIIPGFLELNIKYPTSKMNKIVKIVLAACCLTLINNVVFSGLPIHILGPDFLTVPFEGTPVMVTVILILNIVTSALHVIPLGYVVMVTKLIYEAFNALNKFSHKHCEKHGCKMDNDFNTLRRLHMNLCKLVKDLDEDFGWYYASTFTFYIGMAVFNLYQIIKLPMTTFELVLFLIWLFSLLFSSTLLALNAAYIHDAAHSPLDMIYFINVQDITVEKLAQLNLFLSKLTGTQVGFTTCGLLVITKEFILTIAGVFLTYFAVLYTL